MREEEIHENQKVHLLERDKTGLSLGYRLLWRIRYTANDVYGPASRQPGLNPREQLRVERAQRVATAYRSQGEEPPPAIRRAAGEDGETDSWDTAGGHHGQPPKPFQEGYRYFMLDEEEQAPVMRPNETGDKT